MFIVIVANIGTVFSGNSEEDARTVYDSYVLLSALGKGKGSKQEVNLFKDAEVICGFIPTDENRMAIIGDLTK